MLGLTEQSPQVYVAGDRPTALSDADIDFLRRKLVEQKLPRIRICFHQSSDDLLQEMLILFAGRTYVRPARHLDKEESLLVLEGRGTYFFFDDAGNVTARIPLGPLGSGRSYFCRIPRSVYHCLLVESEFMLAMEATTGPFRPDQTVLAPWSPDAGDRAAAERYLQGLSESC